MSMIGPIRFDVTADQADAIDATPLQVADFSDAPNLIRVPLTLVVYKAAGDAYTVTPDSRLTIRDEDGTIWFTINCTGFLDQATAQTRLHRAAMGRAHNTANKTLSLLCSGSMTKGTASPTLKFALYCEDFPLSW